MESPIDLVDDYARQGTDAALHPVLHEQQWTVFLAEREPKPQAAPGEGEIPNPADDEPAGRGKQRQYPPAREF